ncbi:hypothetical protein [Oleidesulfovibrio sp.]|uniref:hypothetical protein n=1 Tax=Oleidesulfovibrio sp. TaxID=2909707 RepID=UPI003A858134
MEKKARALVAIEEFGIPCGVFFTAPAAVTDMLIAEGRADSKAEESAVYGEDIPAPFEVVLESSVPTAEELSGNTKDWLSAELEKRGVTVPGNAKKDALVELLLKHWADPVTA